MGNAAGVDATASGRILVRQESMKPSDASDMADLESAKSEVSRLRYLASEVASGKFVDDDLDDDDDNLPAPEAVDKLALSMNLSGHDYTPQGAPPREEAAIARRKSLPPMALARAKSQFVRIINVENEDEPRSKVAEKRPNAAANDLFIVNRAKSTPTDTNDLFLSLAFAPDGRTIAAADAGAKVHLHSSRSGEAIGKVDASDAAEGVAATVVTWAATSELVNDPANNVLLSCASDGSIRLWDGAGALRAKTIEMSSAGSHADIGAGAAGHEIRAACFLGGASAAFATAGSGNAMRVYDTATLAESARINENLREADHGLFSNCCLAAHPTDANLLLAGGGQTVHVWDLRANRSVRHFFSTTVRGEAVSISPDGLTACTGSIRTRSPLQLWDIASGQFVSDVRGLGMYNDGKVFATAFSRRAIDPAAGSVLLASGGTDQLRVFAYDPGAGGGAEAEAVGILAEDGPGPGAPSASHIGSVTGSALGPVMALDFSSTGKQHLVAAGGMNGIIRVYEIAKYEYEEESPRAMMFQTMGGSPVVAP